MKFSIITPSFNQLDWLRLCVASVRDQADENSGMLNDGFSMLNSESKIQNPKSKIPPLVVEHIIQDAGTPGIEEFARGIGADFYRDGVLVFASAVDRGSEIGDGRGKGDLGPEGGEENSLLATRHPLPETLPKSKIQNPKSRYRISVHCEPDRGMYDAINRGFSKASGDILAYLNCDEQYLPGALEMVAQRMQSEDRLEMLFSDAVIVEHSGDFICFRKAQIPFRNQLWFRMPVLSCATFMRRHLFSERGIRVDETKKVLGDVMWIMRAQEAGVQMGVLRAFTSIFTETESNLGIGGAADREFLELRKSMPWHVRRFMPLYEFWHKLRSLLSGTRHSPAFTYSLFTKEDFQNRRPVHVSSPTAVWRGRTEIDKKVIATSPSEKN